tara:strand:- start:416 stop:811 length:396 start_codon:yes stop_codon:yes gene_type:complete
MSGEVDITMIYGVHIDIHMHWEKLTSSKEYQNWGNSIIDIIDTDVLLKECLHVFLDYRVDGYLDYADYVIGVPVPTGPTWNLSMSIDAAVLGNLPSIQPQFEEYAKRLKERFDIDILTMTPSLICGVSVST